jgi:hypothetical protein
MGAFRTQELRDLEGWDEALRINEDYNLNARYRRSGRTVWFDSSLRSRYIARSGLPAIASQYFRYGYHKGRLWRAGQRPAARHVPVMAVPVLAGAGAVLLVRALGRRGAAGGVVSALLAVDVLGSEPRAPERATPPAIAAAIVINASWWFGALCGLFGPVRR